MAEEQTTETAALTATVPIASQDQSWTDWIRKHTAFGVVLVFTFALIVFFTAVYLVTHAAGPEAQRWIQEKDILVTGAFLGMVTGGVVGGAAGYAAGRKDGANG